MYMCVYMCAGMHMYVDATEQTWSHFSVAMYLSFRDMITHWAMLAGQQAVGNHKSLPPQC